MIFGGLEFLVLPFLGAGAATIYSSNVVADGGSWGTQPQYAPPPPQYDPGYGQGYQHPYYAAERAQSGEARLSGDGRGHFYCTASYTGLNMTMLVDTGATHCVIGDDAYAYIRGKIDRAEKMQVSVADNRIVDGLLFTFPWLTVQGVTVRDVSTVYLPGKGAGLLGMSFLGRCHMEMRGNEMILRG